MAKLNFSIALGLAADKFKNGLTQAQNQLRSFASTMSKVFGTIGVVELGRGIVQAGRQFQQSMSQVQAVTGATQAQMKAMSDEAKRLGASSKYSASEAANALENLTRNGLTAEQATQALSKTLELAAAGNLDLANAADIATNTMNAFKMQASEIGQINDVMAYAAGHSATNVEMLGQAMTNVAPIAQANNVSFKETTAMLGSLANVGIKGAEAGTKLRQVILGLSKPTDNQKKAFKALGVSITEQDVKTQGLTASLQKLIDAGIMKAGNSNELISQIFGSETTAAAASLLGNLESAKNMLADIQANAEGTAASMAKIQMDTLDGDIKALQSAWEAFSIAMFETKDGAIRSVVQGLTDLVNLAKGNINDLIAFITSAFAAVKLTPIIQQWVVDMQSGEQKAADAARAAATKRAAIEENLTRQKNALAVLEVKQTEVTGSQKVAIDQRVAAKRAEIKRLETSLVEAQNAEQTANTAAQAAAQTTIWTTAWNGVKAAGVMCWTTIKAAMVSTGIGAIIMAITFAIQKLWDYFDMGEKVSKCWDYVCDGCKRAWDWGKNLLTKFGEWYDSLGLIGKAVLAMVAPFTAVYGIIKKIVDTIGKGNSEGTKGGGNRKKVYKTSDGKVYESKAEATKHERALRGSSSTTTTTNNDAGKVYDTDTSKKKTPAQKAAERVADAQLDYEQAIEKAKIRLETGVDTQAQFEQKKYNALESLFDAYSDAMADAPSDKYKAMLNEYADRLQEQGKVLADAKKVEDDAKEKKREEASAAKKLAKAEEDMAKELTKVDKTEAKGRDTTFDYKFTGKNADNLKLQADLEFNLENAQKRLEILKKAAEQGCTEAINQIADAEKKVQSLEDQLKLADVKKHINDLKKELSNLTMEGIQQGWQAVEGTVSSISSLVDTLSDPDASGWEKFAAVINTVMSLMQTFTGIMETVNAITKISSILTGAQTSAKKLEATETTKLAAAETTLAAATPVATAALSAQAGVAAGGGATSATAAAGYSTLASALEIEAAAAIFAAHASMPFVGVPMASGFVGTMEGVLSGVKTAAVALKLSTGGKVKGNSPVGDFVPALLNSGETVINTTQESRLLQLANGGGVAKAQGGKVEFEIHRNTLRGILNNGNMRDSHIN